MPLPPPPPAPPTRSQSPQDGCYIAPSAPGYSITMHPASIAAHTYPTGSVWVKELADRAAAAAAAEGAAAGGAGGAGGKKTLRDW
jgi:hypothetical protein